MTSLKSILPPTLSTPRLTLELFNYSPAHYDCLLSAMNSPTAHRDMGDLGIHTAAAFDALNLATRLDASLEFAPRPPSGVLGPIEVDIDVYYLLRLGHDASGPLIGGVSLCQRGAHVPPDAGWCVLEAYHRQGYASEAATELVRMAVDVLGIMDVMAWPLKGNRASGRVAEKAGLTERRETWDGEGKEATVFLRPGTRFDVGTRLTLRGEEE